MKLEVLKNKLRINGVPESWYSINEGLKPDSSVLFRNYSTWEYFYFDERGNRNNERLFSNEEDAYDYLWEEIKARLIFFNRTPKDI